MDPIPDPLPFEFYVLNEHKKTNSVITKDKPVKTKHMIQYSHDVATLIKTVHKMNYYSIQNKVARSIAKNLQTLSQPR